MKIAKLYVISKLIWVPILIGNPPLDMSNTTWQWQIQQRVRVDYFCPLFQQITSYRMLDNSFHMHFCFSASQTWLFVTYDALILLEVQGISYFFWKPPVTNPLVIFTFCDDEILENLRNHLTHQFQTLMRLIMGNSGYHNKHFDLK